MTPASTSCWAMVTGLMAFVSIFGRAPRCSCLQRSAAMVMNSNLLPTDPLGIMQPPCELGAHCRRKPAVPEASGARPAPRREVGGDPLDAPRLALAPAARRRDDPLELAEGRFEVVVDHHVVVHPGPVDFTARQ